MSLALRRIWRAPAVQALLLQLAAAPLTVVAAFLLLRAGAPVSLAGAALLQGIFAAALSGWRRLAPWWLAIQLLFPLALLAGVALQLPPMLFLGGFLILLLIYWSTFRTQVPYYPSGRRAWDAVAAVLPPDRPLFFIDIGSGLGGLVLDLARRRPESTFVGIELAPLPWLASALRARLAGGSARFVRGDYEHLDLGAYDAVFAYLSPAAMDGLWRKASTEMRPGSLLLSYEFNIGAKPPDINIMPTGAGPALYGWHF
ncbi:SAM-dependent methyltransferase [Massilia eurypsychrophila]|uniref:SAM-dependent methyltransferase n=1 Tax=Massilia eurypsychrophila TaxID=1485217 RepID=A0A2G8THN6_9BURK|nr:class I SAM-dependent methyltransferase [Massilia eurypsychrophila]PIL45570.1 SAM-dependent methyltransferase [Massilia eurypsychrophila]